MDMGMILDALETIGHADVWCLQEVVRLDHGKVEDKDILVQHCVGRMKWAIMVSGVYVGGYSVAVAVSEKWAPFVATITQGYRCMAVTPGGFDGSTRSTLFELFFFNTFDFERLQVSGCERAPPVPRIPWPRGVGDCSGGLAKLVGWHPAEHDGDRHGCELEYSKRHGGDSGHSICIYIAIIVKCIGRGFFSCWGRRQRIVKLS